MKGAVEEASSSSSGSRTDELGAMLSTLQSLDYLAETLAPMLGDGAGAALVTLLEAWKCACRARLLHVTAQGEMLRSFAPEPQNERESLTSVVRRLRSERRVATGRGDGEAEGREAESGDRSNAIAHRMIRAGDLMHVLQPLAYVALLLAQLRGARCLSLGWRRRLPWLAALALEVAGLQLCTLGVRRLAQQAASDEAGHRLAASRTPPSSSLLARQNALELQHRRQLLLLLLLRPSARAAVRRVLEGSGSARPVLRPGSWRHASLEMLSTLETAIWARYWRFERAAD